MSKIFAEEEHNILCLKTLQSGSEYQTNMHTINDVFGLMICLRLNCISVICGDCM